MRISDWSSDVCSSDLLIEPIKAEFQLSDASVGFLTGVALAIFYSAAGLPLGALADRANRRNMIMWAITIWSFFTALCGMAQNFWQLLFARIGVGIGEAGGTPPSHSILADYFTPSQRIVGSEEHTSELQSLMRRSYAVFSLKKKNLQSS